MVVGVVVRRRVDEGEERLGVLGCFLLLVVLVVVVVVDVLDLDSFRR